MEPFQSYGALVLRYFAATKGLNKFSLVTMLTLDGFGRQSKQFLLHLESYLVYEKEHEVGHCHQLCLLLVVFGCQFI